MQLSAPSVPARPSEPGAKRVVIIGGGITGLAAAYELTKRAGPAVQVTVLHGDDKVGGWLKSKPVAGVLCEQGPRGFRSQGAGAYTLQLACELELQSELAPCDRAAAKRFAYLNGKLNLLSVWFVIREFGFWNLVGEFLNWGTRRARPEAEETVSDFFARRFGERARGLAQAMVAGIFAGDATKLSLQACFPAMRDMEASCGSLIRAGLLSMVGLYRPKQPFDACDAVKSLQSQSTMYTFQHGMGLLPIALYEAARKQGATIRLNALAVGLDTTDNGLAVKLVTGEVVPCDRLICTSSPYYLSPLVASLHTSTRDPRLLKCKTDLASIPHSSLTLVNIVGNADCIQVPAKHVGFGFLVPAGDIIGCTMDSAVYSKMYKGKLYKGKQAVCLTVMIGGTLKTREWLQSADVRALSKTWLRDVAGVDMNASEVTFEVTQVLNGIPQYYIGHHAKMGGVADALGAYGIAVAGMGVMGPGVNDSLLSGLRAVQYIASTLPSTLSA
ncbi:Protoporphyrinogen oxidase [Diplonema papillatum]|nr:Protoporphyrinogen oxidase [Diplonema papillatum]